MDQTRQDFIVEIQELIEQLTMNIEQLRVERDGAVRRRLLSEIYRRLHSVKGSAGTIGLEQTSSIAHELESLLALLTTGRADPDQNAFDIIEDGAQLLTDSLSDDSSQVSESDLKDRIEALTKSRDVLAVDEADLQVLPTDVTQALNQDQKRHLAQALVESRKLFVVSASLDVADFDQELRRVNEQLGDVGEIISTHPSIDPQQPDRINFRLLFATAQGSLDLIASENITIREISTSSEPGDVLRQTEPLPLAVRVDVNELASLQNLTETLSRTVNESIDHAIRACESEDQAGDFRKFAAEIDRLRHAIEDKVAGLRKVPIAGILIRAERAGRAAARLTRKEVRFVWAGAHLQIDKQIAETIASPLVHLVRNAVDHGIEPPADRARLGKAPQGLVKIEAARERDQIVIRVTDDGRGIDPETVSAVAAEAGLIERDRTVNLAESIRLIFKPGFSTARTVSTTSGRGVGLDVVETAVQKLGGTVGVRSEVGRGTTVEIVV